MKSTKNLIIFYVFLFVFISLEVKSDQEVSNIKNFYDDYDEDYDEKLNDYISKESNECEDINDEDPIIRYVLCELDGVSIIVSHSRKNGIFYVDGYADNSKCTKLLSPFSRNSTLHIPFGNCGLEKSTIVHLNVTIQPDKNVLDDDTGIFPMSCSYGTYNSTVVYDLPPAEMQYMSDQPVNIIEPPQPKYSIVVSKKPNVDKYKEKDRIVAKIKITPRVEGARAKNCYAFAKNDTNIRYNLTDEVGCSVSSQFPGWEWNNNSTTLTTEFKVFNLIGADITQITCVVESCYDKFQCLTDCPPRDSKRTELEEE